MAVLDVEHNAVVLRIVYDGPPSAGKTTSVRALARSLGRPVETPLEDAGRTVFFDWMEYTGGLFDGHQIRCQIVSMPGQLDLAERRRALLDTADVVVYVVDSGDDIAVARSAEHVAHMTAALRHHLGPPVGVIVQANKRDLPTAVPRDDVRAALGPDFWRTALTESVADEGTGIRETFVLAVRLALDRIRALMDSGELPSGTPDVDSAAQLLSSLEAVPSPPMPAPPPADLTSAVLAATAPRPPRLPDAQVPSGAIWPPVEGRMVLYEATTAGLTPRRVGDGDWLAGVGTGWRVHSAADATFDQFDTGRQALLAWARQHASHADLLSPTRCVVVAAADPDTWRLWQIVKLTPSLRSWLTENADISAPELVEHLAEAAALLADALSQCAGSRLAPTFDTVGRGPRGPHFVALMPTTSASPLPHADIAGIIASELARVLTGELVERRAELAFAAARPIHHRTAGHALVAAVASG